MDGARRLAHADRIARPARRGTAPGGRTGPEGPRRPQVPFESRVGAHHLRRVPVRRGGLHHWGRPRVGAAARRLHRLLGAARAARAPGRRGRGPHHQRGRAHHQQRRGLRAGGPLLDPRAGARMARPADARDRRTRPRRPVAGAARARGDPRLADRPRELPHRWLHTHRGHHPGRAARAPGARPRRPLPGPPAVLRRNRQRGGLQRRARRCTVPRGGGHQRERAVAPRPVLDHQARRGRGHPSPPRSVRPLRVPEPDPRPEPGEPGPHARQSAAPRGGGERRGGDQ